MKLREICCESATNNIPVELYRGLANPQAKNAGAIVEFSIRSDRTPKDSPIFQSAMFNLGIQRKLGIPEIRKSCAFATTDIGMASDYSEGYTGRGADGMVIKLLVPPQAKIVFNRGMDDSLTMLESNVIFNVYETALYKLGRERDEIYTITDDVVDVQLYLSTTADALIKKVIAEITDDPAIASQLFDRTVDEADNMVRGYEVATPQAFAEEEFGAMEAMIVGVSTCGGEIVDTHYYNG